MPALAVLVDFDNVDPMLRRAGPVNFAKSLVAAIPPSITTKHGALLVRLYGGWRSQGILTTSAQRLVPDIRGASPANVVVADAGVLTNVRLAVELSEKAMGSNALFTDTLAKERGLRSFRTRTSPWHECEDVTACGFRGYANASSSTSYAHVTCGVRLDDILVRDEQKMVDTMIVADIAYKALVDKVSDIVIVSSDTDMWPGVMLALRAGCYVTHVHTRSGGKTQRHLLNTLEGHMGMFYQQVSI
jgi:uncharacterized LabA/DUF88 family protein